MLRVKVGDAASCGVMVELLMLSSAAAIIAGLFVSIPILSMDAAVFYGILKLKRMQPTYDANLSQKAAKEKDSQAG